MCDPVMYTDFISGPLVLYDTDTEVRDDRSTYDTPEASDSDSEYSNDIYVYIVDDY